MKNDRIISVIIMLTLILTYLPLAKSQPAYAASPHVTISHAEAQPGDEINLTVSISGNPGITSVDFFVDYDTKQFELTAKQNGMLLGGTVNSQTLDKTPYYCGWINSLQTKNCVDDGVLITLSFKVKEEAVNGKHLISFTKDNITAYNADIKEINFEAVNGYVEVKGGKDAADDAQQNEQKPSASQDSKLPSSSGISGNGVAAGTINSTNADIPSDSGKVQSDNNASKDKNEEKLTAKQKKTIAKVEAMKIKWVSAKYSKEKKTCTLKYKKTDKSYRLDGYQIYRSAKKNKNYKRVATVTTTKWIDKKALKKGVAVYYKIRGFRKIEDKLYYTQWSTKKKITAK